MEENAIKTSITTYKFQLEQVDQAIQAAGETDDLVTLRGDLLELIKLTEESLLSLKKGQLLKQLDDADVESNAFDRDGQSSQTESNGKSTTTSGTSEMDEEYAAFQAMLGGDVICSDPVTPALEGETSATGSNIADIYQDIVGTKCQAPFVHEWGEKSYGNALIAGFETLSDVELPKVRVMFCNPTHVSMLPCRYHLEGSCKFTEDKCRFSHGHIVDLEELQEYQEPDYSLLKMEAPCLARYDADNIWYKATVVDMDDDSVTVMFKSYEDESSTLAFHDVLPILSIENDQDSSDSDEDIEAIHKDDTDYDDDSLPVFLWKPPSYGLGDLGQWEAHTKGIGSKLMTQMGYVPGEGLGKNGEGRIEPVPIQLLPPGKSLDKIMRLKELAGGRDMFDVMKKQEKKMKKQAEKHAQGYQRQYKPNMFDFINKKLGGKKGKLSELIHKHEDECHSTGHKSQDHGRLHRNISEQDLHKKSERNINIQLLKTSEEIKSVQKELVKLKQSLSRNENRDKAMAAQVRQKIQSMEAYLDKLKSSEDTMSKHQKKRNDHKKLIVF